MQCRRPFGAAVPPFGGITRPPAGGGQASAGLAAGGNGAAGHGAAGTVPGGYGTSIEARFHRARHLVPAKAGTAYGAAYWRHGSWRHASGPPSAGRAILAGRAIPPGCAIPQSPQPLKARNPSKSATSQGAQSLKVRNLSRHAIRPGTQSVSPHPGGGPPARSGRREWCRAIARHEVWCRPTGRRKTAWQRPGSKPAAALLPAGPIGPAGMVPPIGGTKYGAARLGGTGNGACNCRHGMVPAKAGTVPGGAVLGSREQSADWRTVLAGRQIGIGDSPAGNAEPGDADVREHGVWECGVREHGVWECGVREHGVWECGCLGACGVRGLPAGPIGPAGAVPPIGGTVYRRLKWCRQSAARYVVPPCWAARFRRRPAEPPADRPAARSGGAGVARSPGGPRKDAWGRPGSGRSGVLVSGR